ncbi:MAG: DUF1566 domain-containing protein, partial [Chromatiales bacterium]
MKQATKQSRGERLMTARVIMAALALGWASSAGAQFPASGQTTSVRAADDGDLEAGATLSYTDNGDGTITDNNTGLQWEKKSDDGTIHDKDNIYTWEEAFAVHVAGLNTEPCFSGHCDWRVPNVKELQSIVNYGVPFPGPVVSPAFNNNCVGATVLTGSCTAASLYWSATTGAGNRARRRSPNFAWFVGFVGGSVRG